MKAGFRVGRDIVCNRTIYLFIYSFSVKDVLNYTCISIEVFCLSKIKEYKVSCLFYSIS